MFKQNNQYSKLIYVPNPAFQPQSAPIFIEKYMHYVAKKADSTVYSTGFSKYNLNRRMRQLLRQLQGQSQLKILNTDKNLGPAIMTTLQYNQFCLDHLQQGDTYMQVESIPLAEIKLRIAAFHSVLCSTVPHWIRDARIIVHGLDVATPAYFHALPKIHKKPMGCRPIVSSINSPTTGLSKWVTYVLTPIATQIQSFVRDSDSLQREIINLTTSNHQQMYTFDVENMYTSIPVEAALHAVHWFLIRNNYPYPQLIISALRIVLECNFFTFGETNWKQLQGLAMGTPVAPVVATLYLGYYEETRILPMFKDRLYLYKRYLDDILIFWKPDPANPYAFNRFRAVLRQTPGLSWKFEEHGESANFLDLSIFRYDGKFATRTYQKALNLYLYPTYNSAHTPEVKKGMIYGLLKKYKLQNTLTEDFLSISKALFQRFLARGYKFSTLKRFFQDSLLRLNSENPSGNIQLRTTPEPKNLPNPARQYFFKIPFDPNGPSRSQLRRKLSLDEFSQVLSETYNSKITICYQRPDNLGKKLMRTRTTKNPPSDPAI